MLARHEFLGGFHGHGGIAAAEFAGDQCGACRLQMIPAELAGVKTAPVDDVVRCEECRRILVRTDESGL